jgi:hypothetical protein
MNILIRLRRRLAAVREQALVVIGLAILAAARARHSSRSAGENL